MNGILAFSHPCANASLNGPINAANPLPFIILKAETKNKQKKKH